MKADPIRILLVEDHAIVRAGIRALVEGEPDMTIVGETGDGEQAPYLAVTLQPDIILVDLRLTGERTGINGTEATRRLTRAVPSAKVVILTGLRGRAEIVGAMQAGARGYVLKAGPPEELFRAIRAVAHGGNALDSHATGQLVAQLTDPAPLLSERETQVVRLLAQGLRNHAIADALFLTEATVKTHLIRIYRKLGVGNRAQAVSEATRRGILDLDTLTAGDRPAPDRAR